MTCDFTLCPGYHADAPDGSACRCWRLEGVEQCNIYVNVVHPFNQRRCAVQDSGGNNCPEVSIHDGLCERCHTNVVNGAYGGTSSTP
jgi:hypothetical protein